MKVTNFLWGSSYLAITGKTFHFPENMLNKITSTISNAEALPEK